MFSSIKAKLSFKAHDEATCKAMEYAEQGWFIQAVSEIEKYECLRDWLESGYEDRRHNAFEFYAKALKWFGFDWDEVESEFSECRELLDGEKIICNILYAETQIIPSYTRSKMDSWNTAFAKHYQALDAKMKKLINLSDFKERFERKTLNEILSECGVIAQEHYRANEGKLERCGEILGYRVEILGKVCRLDVKGRFVRVLRKALCEESREDLFLRVRERVQKSSHNGLAEKMGFVDFWRFKKGAEILSKCESLEEWIGRGFYALGVRASEFFVELSDVLFDEREEAMEVAKKHRNISRRCERFDGVIFVITQRRGKELVEFVSDYGVGIFNEMRQIHLDRSEFRKKTHKEVLSLLGEKIKWHFVRNDGELKVWGKILGYKIKMYEKIFEFSTQGQLLQVVEVEEKISEKIKGLTQIAKEKSNLKN